MTDNSPLLHLPDELLVEIARAAEALQGHTASLGALAATSRRLRLAAQGVLLAYLNVTSDNASDVVAWLRRLDEAQSRRRVKGVRFANVDQGLQIRQPQVVEVLQLLPHVQQLKIMFFGGASLLPRLRTAIRQLVRLKRFTVSIDIRHRLLAEQPIIRDFFEALPSSAELDVLHVAASEGRYARDLGVPISVRCKSIVLDGPAASTHGDYSDLDDHWRRLIFDGELTALDVSAWTRGFRIDELARLAPTLRALCITVPAPATRAHTDLDSLQWAMVSLPHLTTIETDALWGGTVLSHFLGQPLRLPFFNGLETISIFYRGSTYHELSLPSLSGLPRLRRFILIGHIRLDLPHGSNVSIRVVNYPGTPHAPRILRTDLLWLAETGEHRFLTE